MGFTKKDATPVYGYTGVGSPFASAIFLCPNAGRGKQAL
jgi:hypothetical protein